MSSLREYWPRQLDRTRLVNRTMSLVSRLSHDMHARWTRGEKVRVEDYLARYPELVQDRESALGLVYEELCLGEACGESLTLADLVGRFPQWEKGLKRLLDCRSLLATGPRVAPFPECGDVLGSFRLVAELGEGNHGKVFLATEPKLANRALVLKLTAATGREHLSLARLQHTHIVPLYFVEDDFSSGMRVLGMPYFGGASLERFLRRVHKRPLAERTGKDIVDWLMEEHRTIPKDLEVSSAGLDRLASLSYSSVICWIGICMAEAIQYAHDKGLVHLDLKPSNILLTADGEPMLLDFHLAREPIRAGNRATLWLGGTKRYMSPEQSIVFDAISRGDPIDHDVDERSDIFSLGVVLYELLGGTSPLDAGALETLRKIGQRTSAGLADIIAKCLSQAPVDRYPTAADLAADLRCHLTNQPLRGVPNRSLVERWRKWRRRAPHALRNWILLAVLTGAIGVVGSLVWDHARFGRDQARALLDEGRQRLADSHFELARKALGEGLRLARGPLGNAELAGEFERELRNTDRIQLAQGFNSLMEELRNLYGFKPLPQREALEILPRCQNVWLHREGLLRQSGASRPASEQVRLRGNLLELALLWTDLRMRTAASPEAKEALRRGTLSILDEAEAIAGPSAVIAYERANLRGTAAEFDVPGALARFSNKEAPRAGWEAYALGLALLDDERLKEAGDCLERAMEFQPGSLWTQYYYGRCQFELKKYSAAARAFSACIALSPNHAGAYFNRALSFEALQEGDHALRDYSQALMLDPRMAQAALNRGVLHYLRQEYTASRTDLERALSLGADPVTANYNLALVSVALGQFADASVALDRVLQQSPDHAGANHLAHTIRGK